MLCFVDENKKMFPAQVMQNYTLTDNETTMGTYDRIEHPLVAHRENSAGPSKVTPNKVPVLSAHKKGYHKFRRNQDRLKSVKLFGKKSYGYIEFSKGDS